jgi:hypothetical protein
VARGEGRGALIGGITGLLLSLADLEGPLARRLRLTLMVAAGIAVGGLLATWLKSFEAIFWIAFFLPVFAAGFWSARARISPCGSAPSPLRSLPGCRQLKR